MTALAVSRLMGPGVSFSLLLVIVLWQSRLFQSSDWPIASLLIIIAIGLPALTFALGRYQGWLSDVDLTDRLEREPIYAVSLIALLICIILIKLFKLPVLVEAVFSAGMVIGLVFAGINRRWKISLHSAFWTVLSLLLWFLFGPVWLLFSLGLLPIGVVRIALKKHSAGQVVIGSLLAGLLFLIILRFFGLV